MSRTTEEEQTTLRGLDPDAAEAVAERERASAEPGEEEPDPHGESRPVSPTAPASSGMPVAERGEVDPEHSPDLRPRDSAGARTAGAGDETPAPDPTRGETEVEKDEGHRA